MLPSFLPDMFLPEHASRPPAQRLRDHFDLQTIWSARQVKMPRCSRNFFRLQAIGARLACVIVLASHHDKPSRTSLAATTIGRISLAIKGWYLREPLEGL